MNYLLFIFLSTLLVSCEKDNTSQSNISDDIKRLAIFKTNSKWIYQEESSLATDTVTITESDLINSCYNLDNDVICEEFCTMTYFSSYYNYNYTDKIRAGSVSRTKEDINDSTWLSGAILADQNRMQYMNQSPSYGYKYHRQQLPSISIKGKTYYDIVIFLIDNLKITGSSDYKAKEYFYAKNNGIIRKKFYDSTSVKSWDLIHKEVYQ